MAQTPTQASGIDTLANTIVQIIAGLTNNVEAPAIDAAAEGAEPFLAWPVVKQVFEAVVSDLTGQMAIVEEQGILKVVFELQADSRLATLASTALALNKAQQSGDANAISQATQDAANAWGSIIHNPGIAPVES